MSERPTSEPRHAQLFFTRITTQWMDDDLHGQINNVVCHGFFDTAVNNYRIDRGALNIHGGDAIGLDVYVGCVSHRPVALPREVLAALAPRRTGHA
jgi:acyl-CoA thioester hydrolase